MKQAKSIFLLHALLWVLAGCSSATVSVQKDAAVKGKKIGIGTITLESVKKKRSSDTICTCIAQNTRELFIPYLQQAGFTVINLSLPAKPTQAEMVILCDSLQLDYLLTGSGMVSIVGNSTFMEELGTKIMAVKTGEVIASASFSAISIRPPRAVKKICNKLIKELH